MSKRVLVTGVTGMDGSHMADFLLEKTDYEIYGMARRLSVKNHANIKSALESKRFKIVTGDLSDSQSIASIFCSIKPDYFINLAAQSFVGSSWDLPEQTMDINATGPLRCLESIVRYNRDCRYYNAGSSEEFGDVVFCPQNEDHPLRARSPYGASKIAARQIVKTYRDSFGLYAVQGYLFNHEGFRRGEEFVTRKITKGVARIHKELSQSEDIKPIYLGNIYSKRDWSHSLDFVEGIWMMLNQEEYNPILWGLKGKDLTSSLREYVLSSNETHSVKEFVELAFQEAGINGRWTYKGSKDPLNEVYVLDGDESQALVAIDPQFYRPAEVDLLHGDSTRVRMELGWRPKISFNELVREMVMNDLKG